MSTNPANRQRLSAQRGAVLLIALITVLLMSMLGATLMRAGLFHEKLSANNRLDSFTFWAAESAITASMAAIDKQQRWQDLILSGRVWDVCLTQSGIAETDCDKPGFPLADGNGDARASALAARTQTRYMGGSPLPGFAVDQVVIQRFSTEGRAYYSDHSPLPFGHLNMQVWQRIGTDTGVFYQ